MFSTQIVPLQCANQRLDYSCNAEGLFACKDCKIVSVSVAKSLQTTWTTSNTLGVLWIHMPEGPLEGPQDKVQKSS